MLTFQYSIKNVMLEVFGAANRNILWNHLHGKQSCGYPAWTYIDQLMKDTGLRTMEDCEFLSRFVMNI